MYFCLVPKGSCPRAGPVAPTALDDFDRGKLDLPVAWRYHITCLCTSSSWLSEPENCNLTWKWLDWSHTIIFRDSLQSFRDGQYIVLVTSVGSGYYILSSAHIHLQRWKLCPDLWYDRDLFTYFIPPRTGEEWYILVKCSPEVFRV